jgi:putative transposase
MLPGEIYHLTHRCHNKEFLLRFARDRTEYCKRLREIIRKFNIELFSYSVTQNHTHLLATAARIEDISMFIHDLDGGFASYYNARKKGRKNAFWGERFNSTMIESGDHLLNCIAYIDLNMVRAGVVLHPGDWDWCAYREFMGQRQRNLILNLERLIELAGVGTINNLRAEVEARIRYALQQRALLREPFWTEGIAVGSEAYVKAIGERISRQRRIVTPVRENSGAWVVYEAPGAYLTKTGSKIANKACF